MAFRTKENCLAIVILAASLGAQPLTFTARKHTLTVDDSGVTLDQRHWTYTDIRRLTLASNRLAILTYKNRKWHAVDHLPDGAAAQLYPMFRQRMDQRFVAELPDPDVQPLWRMPAKVERGWKGANGMLIVGADRIVFETAVHDASRTWRYTDIANISHSGIFDLSLSTHLGTEVRFSLKEPLTEERFHALWLRLEEVNGLRPYQSILGQHKEN
ncbi:MAG: hypothetical protein ABSH47_19505 [Bryobacteraceae bacterium]|jgi:hypothetical protein